MEEKSNGKIIFKTPLICECCIRIDGKYKKLNPFKKTQTMEVPYGKHSINVGISYDQTPESSKVHSAITWAWENDKKIEINEKDIIIELKRKWHLFKPVTAEAKIKSQ